MTIDESIVGLVGAAVAVATVIIQTLKVADSQHRRLIVLGVSIALCIGAKLTGACFANTDIPALIFKSLVVAGGVTIGYQAVVHPAAAGLKEAAERLAVSIAGKAGKIKK